MITLARLKEVLEYKPESGDFVCLVNRGANSQVGRIAGALQGNGYIYIKVDRRLYKAHRLAWLYMTGAWPSKDVDHVNCQKADNRWANLREATKSQNLHNVREARKNNKSSGLLGASWHRGLGKWQAQICVDRKKRCLGYFGSAEAAHAAYLSAKRGLVAV